MGFKLGAIMLEGNHVDDVPSILKAFDNSVEDTVTEVNAASSMWKQAGRSHYGVALYGPWTVVIDPHDCRLLAEEETCAELSRRYHCRLVGAILHDVSNSYWFLMFDKGQLRRRFISSDNEIEQEGEPLPEEAGSADERPDEKVMHVMRRFGVNVIDLTNPSSFAFEEAGRFFVCRSLEALAEERSLAATRASARPWWKFW